MSARHQVKRLDRLSREPAPSNRSGRRNRFSSFGADLPKRSAISPGPKPGVRSGPDVFADALAPRKLRVSPGGCFSGALLRWPAHPAPGSHLPDILFDCSRVLTDFGTPSLHPVRHASRSRYQVRREHLTAADAAGAPGSHPGSVTGRRIAPTLRVDEVADVAAMVIVPPNGRVNRISPIGTSCCAAVVSAIPRRAAPWRVYTPFIANLKLPFKFDRP